MRPSDTTHLQWLQDLEITDYSGLNILDLGCGSGYLCQKFMENKAQHCTGVDVEPPQHQSDSWNFQKVDLNLKNWEQKFETQKFDLILGFDIIEHLDSPYLFLESCKNLLTKKGTLVITTPNINSWEKHLKPDTWSGASDPQHKILFNCYSLEFLGKKAQLKPKSICAPVRKLKFLGKACPQIGGQILSSWSL